MESTNNSHWRHIHDNSCELVFTEILVREVSGHAVVFKRETYKKRNGKKCYMDYPSIKFTIDESRIMRRSSYGHETSNVWERPTGSKKWVVFRPDYKQELINEYRILKP